MLSQEQQKWIAHLSNTDMVSILPYDPKAEEIFQKVKREIQKFCKRKINVEHHGATSLKISGQDEIDIYIPVHPSKFESTIKLISGL